MLAFHLAVTILALGFEAALGYPQSVFNRIGHPVTWIGALIAWLDRRFNRDRDPFPTRRRAGLASLAALLFVTGLCAFALETLVAATTPRVLALLILGLLASTCLAQRSLDRHVRDVRDALRQAGLAAGQRQVARIVGRDTAVLDEAGVSRAAIESLAENFADGIVAPSLFLALGGVTGGMLYKAVNTADSMIGHRSPRHEAFGFGAAKLDDIVNWPAARLAGLWIVLAAALVPEASATTAWRIMRRDARGHPSPNAGWPEAAMAGALGIQLGGARTYAGRIVEDAAMGDGPQPNAATITLALTLYRLACGLNALAILGVTLVIALIS